MAQRPAAPERLRGAGPKLRAAMPSEASAEAESGMRDVVVVTGPTSAGKSACALELGLAFDGEIVNADSMQVYRYMDIGTAKPSLAMRSRLPHHLYDVADPDESYSAGRYQGEARAAAQRIHAAGRCVFLTGGTGLYIRAFLHGLVDAGPADPEFRRGLEAEAERARARRARPPARAAA